MGNRSTKLSKKDMEYLEQRTHFTRKQIKEWHKGFMVSGSSTFFWYIAFFFGFTTTMIIKLLDISVNKLRKFDNSNKLYIYSIFIENLSIFTL